MSEASTHFPAAYPVVEGEDTRYVLTAPAVRTDGIVESCLAIEVDKQGLPLPSAHRRNQVTTVGIGDYESHATLELPQSLPSEREKHFHSGNTVPSTGLLHIADYSFTDFSSVEGELLNERKLVAESIRMGKPLTLAALSAMAIDLATRDHSHVNNQHRPERLALVSARAAIDAAAATNIIDAHTLRDEVEEAVNDAEVWGILRENYDLDSKGPEGVMREYDRWRQLGMPTVSLRTVEPVVRAMVTPHAIRLTQQSS